LTLTERRISMNRKQAIKELKKLQKTGDPEYAHGTADDILCKILKELGYQDVLDEYYKVPKWYA